MDIQVRRNDSNTGWAIRFPDNTETWIGDREIKGFVTEFWPEYELRIRAIRYGWATWAKICAAEHERIEGNARGQSVRPNLRLRTSGE